MLLMRLAEDVAELGTVEQAPQQDGRNMTMLLAPVKRRPQEAQSPDGASPRENSAPPQAEAS
jgi:translation initiation factor IF-3